ncbi:MAG: hypothetical protein LRY36_02495 [Alphaproteobacteria bacterium]|nr:hypothetical protein [Alphaproteobacteria bacterium]MCD8566773.1 hypothetical protein [Alphaproteobacteria bacterium]
MIIVSDFNNTLEVDGQINPALLGYLLTMAQDGHKVAVFSGNPDQAREVLAEFDPSGLIHIGDKNGVGSAGLHGWLKLQGARRVDISFDDDHASPLANKLFCRFPFDPHSDGFDAFMVRVGEAGALQASADLVLPQAVAASAAGMAPGF